MLLVQHRCKDDSRCTGQVTYQRCFPVSSVDWIWIWIHPSISVSVWMSGMIWNRAFVAVPWPTCLFSMWQLGRLPRIGSRVVDAIYETPYLPSAISGVDRPCIDTVCRYWDNTRHRAHISDSGIRWASAFSQDTENIRLPKENAEGILIAITRLPWETLRKSIIITYTFTDNINIFIPCQEKSLTNDITGKWFILTPKTTVFDALKTGPWKPWFFRGFFIKITIRN